MKTIRNFLELHRWFVTQSTDYRGYFQWKEAPQWIRAWTIFMWLSYSQGLRSWWRFRKFRKEDQLATRIMNALEARKAIQQTLGGQSG